MTDFAATDSIRLDHMAFWVSDLGRSTRFYRDGLGFQVGDGGEFTTPDMARLLGRDHEVRLRLRRMERDGFKLTLVQYVSDKDVSRDRRVIAHQPGSAAMSFDVKDLEQAVAKASSAGGTVQGSITIGQGRIVTLSDPDGYIVEFNERP